MPQKRYKPEEIIHKLRVAEVELSKGCNTGQICRKLGITEQTYYRWRKQYGGMKVEQARRFKELEAENTRLKKLHQKTSEPGKAKACHNICTKNIFWNCIATSGM